MRLNIHFSKFRFRIPSSLALSPRRYWSKFVAFLVVMFILVLMFDAWVFWRFSLGGGKRDSGLDASSLPSVRQEELVRARERIYQKRANYEKYKAGVDIEDPSGLK